MSLYRYSLATIGVCVFCAAASVAALFVLPQNQKKKGHHYEKTTALLSLLLAICLLLGACAQGVEEIASTIADGVKAGNASVIESTDYEGTEQLSAISKNESAPEKGTYREGVALVKYEGDLNDNVLSQLNLVSATALYSGSTWYTVELAAGADTVETVSYLRELGCFDKVDFDYIMGASAEVESVGVAGNPHYDKEQKKYYDTLKIKEGWDYLKKNDLNPGGSPDVIVAVIDTGVDYNHLDLRNNIWVNPGEIPDNGKDDDGNGYVDDIYGWNFVSNNKRC